MGEQNITCLTKKREVSRIYKELPQISKNINKPTGKIKKVHKRNSVISLIGNQYSQTLLV